MRKRTLTLLHTNRKNLNNLINALLGRWECWQIWVPTVLHEYPAFDSTGSVAKLGIVDVTAEIRGRAIIRSPLLFSGPRLSFLSCRTGARRIIPLAAPFPFCAAFRFLPHPDPL